MNSSFSDLGDSLFDISPNMILVVEDNAFIGAANPIALKELGFEAGELIGKKLCELFVISEAEDSNSAVAVFNWLTSQDKEDNFIKVKTSNARIFRSRISIGGSRESADGRFRRVIFIHDSGELDSAMTEQDRYKYLLDTALAEIPDGFAVYDEDDRLQIFNKAYGDVYQRSKPILKLGKKFEDILRFGLNAGQYVEAGNTKESHEAWLEKRLELHSNPTGPTIQNVGDRWLRVEERKLEDGRTVGIRADITQLVEAKSTAEMLGNVLDDIAAPVAFLNLETIKFEYGNKALLNKLLYTLEEFVELDPKDVSASLPDSDFRDFIQKAVNNPDKVTSLRSVHRRKDGTTFPCLINATCEMKNGSKRLVSFIHDETEEAKMRDELAIQRAKLETLVHNLPCLITHSMPDTTLLFVNEDYANFFGVKANDVIGKSFNMFASESDEIKVIAGISRLTEESPIFTRESYGSNHLGKSYTLLWTNRMLYRQGKPYELVSIGRDITDIKNAEIKIERQAYQLELRNQALEQFAGIVSHDLRSPLRHIRLFGEMLLEEYEEGKSDNFSKYIGKMREGVLRMDRLIVSLLEFSQVAYQQVNRSKFMLSAAIEEAKDNLAGTIVDKHANVSIRGDDAQIQLDYVLFVRLLENLIDNSVKYSNDANAPKIYIDGKRNDDSTIITITDNGIGIPSDQNEKIFNVFQRLHVDEKKYKGTGIGLALAKRIVEGHNGTIKLDVDFVGGTRFVMSFPSLN